MWAVGRGTLSRSPHRPPHVPQKMQRLTTGFRIREAVPKGEHITVEGLTIGRLARLGSAHLETVRYCTGK